VFEKDGCGAQLKTGAAVDEYHAQLQHVRNYVQVAPRPPPPGLPPLTACGLRLVRASPRRVASSWSSAGCCSAAALNDICRR
jgi:hypothetical protein